MRSYIEYLNEKMAHLDEEASPTLLNVVIGKHDPLKMSHVIVMDDIDIYQENDPDFEDGFVIERGATGKLRLLQRFNLTHLSKVTKTPIEELRNILLDFIKDKFYRLDARMDTEEGDDIRGYYKILDVVNEKTEEKDGNVYLDVELLLDFVEPTGMSARKKQSEEQ